jgi:penicillin-binding protein 1C
VRLAQASIHTPGLSKELRRRGWRRRRGLGVLPVLALAAASAFAVPAFDAVRAAHTPSDRPLLDRHGAVLQTVRIDDTVRRGPWLALDDISPALREAIVFSEDRRFWAHSGVDWRALAAGAWATAWNSRTRGASTLTMQLAGLLDDDLARPSGGRSIGQKLSQLRHAQQLEAGWSKTQILEAYLNRVPLRGELVGVAAASRVLFGKHASGLDAIEASLLAAMVRGPNADAGVLERRACEVLRQQQLACSGLAITLAQALARRPGPLPSTSGEALAPHLARQMPASGSGPWRSTLDASVQRVALSALRRQLAELRGREVEDGAVIVLDNASGEVLAWVGSSGAGSAAAEVDAVLARRQPGSTIKPFVYALALEQRLITAASVLDDAPLQLAAGAALYQPQNYDGGFKGAVSVRTALASSLNVPAVRVGAMLGPDAVFAKLVDAGLRPRESAGYHGHALALGSAEVSLLDLSNAYRLLAQRGVWSPVRWHAASPVTPARRVFTADAAFVVSDILADPAARALTFGLDSPLVTRGWAAVKTGTSKDMRDNWCIGYTSRYTVGVWVGNAGGAPMHGVSGVSGAAPVWREVVAHLHAGAPSRTPAPAPGLVAQRGEWFLAGTEARPGGAANAGHAQAFGIEAPRDGSVVLLDPDIPMAAQRLSFVGEPGQWSVNGRAVGSGSLVHWLPRPGRFVLERRSDRADRQGPADRVSFEVRATPPPTRP